VGGGGRVSLCLVGLGVVGVYVTLGLSRDVLVVLLVVWFLLFGCLLVSIVFVCSCVGCCMGGV